MGQRFWREKLTTEWTEEFGEMAEVLVNPGSYSLDNDWDGSDKKMVGCSVSRIERSCSF